MDYIAAMTGPADGTFAFAAVRTIISTAPSAQWRSATPSADTVDFTIKLIDASALHKKWNSG